MSTEIQPAVCNAGVDCKDDPDVAVEGGIPVDEDMPQWLKVITIIGLLCVFIPGLIIMLGWALFESRKQLREKEKKWKKRKKPRKWWKKLIAKFLCWLVTLLKWIVTIVGILVIALGIILVVACIVSLIIALAG